MSNAAKTIENGLRLAESGAAVAATWIVRGDESRRPGHSVETGAPGARSSAESPPPRYANLKRGLGWHRDDGPADGATLAPVVSVWAAITVPSRRAARS